MDFDHTYDRESSSQQDIYQDTVQSQQECTESSNEERIKAVHHTQNPLQNYQQRLESIKLDLGYRIRSIRYAFKKSKLGGCKTASINCYY